MIGLLEPLGLAAVASGLLPLIIHLVRRADRRPLPFAALHFLSERRHPQREWQLQEWPLLALRLGLLAAVSVLLAVPLWRGQRAAPDAAGVGSPRREVRIAFDGASRLRQLDAETPQDTQLIVAVPEALGGLDAERLRLGHAVRWEIVPGQPAPAGPVAEPGRSPRAMAIRVDPSGNAELPLAKALSAAWTATSAPASLDIAAQAVPVPAQAEALLWLGGRLSAQAAGWVSRGGRVLLSRDPASLGAAVLADANGAVTFRERSMGSGRILSTDVALTLDALPELRAAATAERLLSALSAPLTAPDRAHAADVAPLRNDDPDARSVRLTEYAGVLAALLFLAERLWATRAS